MAAKVTGLPAIKRKLQEWPATTAREVEKALQEGAEHIRDVARVIVPADTGELRNAIEVRSTLEGFTPRGATGNFARMVSGAAGRLQRFIGVFPAKAGAPGWYAAWVEFGTAPRRAGERYLTLGGRSKVGKASAIGDFHPGTAPQPFLLPAFFSQRRYVIARINRALGKAAKRVAKGG